MNRKTVAILFAVLCLAQWIVPGKMIWDKEKIMENGREYQFLVRPVDPNDPMRGKYVVLSFDPRTFIVDGPGMKVGDLVYITLYEDSDGISYPSELKTERPDAYVDFFEAKISGVNGAEVEIACPFDRFYMEESKAPQAETIFRQSFSDLSQQTVAIVHILEGEAVLKDVQIGGVSLTQLAGE